MGRGFFIITESYGQEPAVWPLGNLGRLGKVPIILITPIIPTAPIRGGE